MENPAPQNSAIKSPHDERDFTLGEVVAHAPVPFDWETGYDATEELLQIVGPSAIIKAKNQNGSGSCGGQSESYGGAVLSGINTKTYEEKSAKFTYAPIAAPNGGGSSGRDLSDRAINVGWGSEALTPSYDNGNPPSEDFMARAQDITPDAVAHAAQTRAKNYFLCPIDIDSVAIAIRDFKFVRLGVVGSNNGTWLTTDPLHPKDGDVLWYHWLAGLKAKMRNGKKAIGVINSWGPNAGNQGEQWLNEDWFKSQLTNAPYGSVPIFEPRGYTWNVVPVPPAFHHVFNQDLERGMVDPECIQLQTALRIDGEFPSTVPFSTTFGPATLAAVQKFQVKYGIIPAGAPGYGRCGPKTRAVLNAHFGL